ncbi:Spy/CpxP family protein refolding chaperone [Niabella insulamsoli]|uniref:Spy/CpxP family protein refolding chaperone n=1 Tax=Niabella insulamsoli TaxID=3144874 RepID=UPI0031FCD5E8
MPQSRSTNKFLVFIIFLLLVTNVLVIGYFLLGGKKKPKKEKSKDSFAAILQREVGFNDEQVARFNKLRETHWANAKAKMDQIIDVKNVIFDLTKQPNTPDSVVETLADSIGRLQKQVEISAFRHVTETRKICTPSQEPAYDSLMIRIINKGKSRRPAAAAGASK